MRTRHMLITFLLFTTALAPAMGATTRDFLIERCDFADSGKNPYWTLNPGSYMRFEGMEDGVFIELEITVLSSKKTISFTTANGHPMTVRTRIIKEREWEDGELVEISRNFFARCKRTDGIFYFGENVNIYENGNVVSHEGAWRAGRDGAQPGLIMPGTFLLGAKYFQEIAPDVAMDRAKHVAMGLTVTTPAGTFVDCVKVVETTPLDPEERSVKIYAPGVGLIFDDGLELVAYRRR